MIQELVYTSAPRGLKVGSRGFCTVATTPGMPKNLADKLESLSGYRHLHPPVGAPDGRNPINYSFVRFRLGGMEYAVLSRVADAGLDHTQRSNKIAHHLVVDQQSQVNAGPAWLAAQVNMFETSWKSDPETMPGTRQLAEGELACGSCSSWEAATGDAGWAGVLAESCTQRRGEMWVVYPPELEVLPLIMEAQALLPPVLRWEATFSTYFTKVPPGVECRWRFVIAGSPEAAQVLRNRGRLAIDLTADLPQAEGGPLVARARGGDSVDAQLASESSMAASAGVTSSGVL